MDDRIKGALKYAGIDFSEKEEWILAIPLKKEIPFQDIRGLKVKKIKPPHSEARMFKFFLIAKAVFQRLIYPSTVFYEEQNSDDYPDDYGILIYLKSQKKPVWWKKSNISYLLVSAGVRELNTIIKTRASTSSA